MKRALLLLLLFAGCRSPASGSSVGCVTVSIDDPLARITVADAHLEALSLWQAGLAIGHAEGDALLVVHDTSGVESTFAARLDGDHLGLTADASVDFGNGNYDLVLPATASVTARQLLGLYQGPHVGLDVGVGGHWRNLANTGGVTLNITTLSFGLGAVPASLETLDLELFDDPIRVITGEGEGEGEGDFQCAFDGEACVGDGDCCSGTCVAGACTRGCSASEECDVGQACETVRSLDGTSEGGACLLVGHSENDRCFSTDSGACPDGLVCRPTLTDGVEITDMRCRVPCDDDATCAADRECLPTLLGAGHDCAVRIAATTLQNADAPPACDDNSALYCDQSMFVGASKPGVDVCSGGMCLPLCAIPAVDVDEDGLIGATDHPIQRFDCGPGFTCTPELALRFNVFEDVWRKEGSGISNNRIPCSCGEGVACPTDCRIDDAFCHAVDGAEVCVAPFETCEPAP